MDVLFHAMKRFSPQKAVQARPTEIISEKKMGPSVKPAQRGRETEPNYVVDIMAALRPFFPRSGRPRFESPTRDPA